MTVENGKWILVNYAKFNASKSNYEPEIYKQSAPNNSNETHTFMYLGSSIQWMGQDISLKSERKTP